MRRHDLTNMRTRSIDAVTAMRIRQYEQLTGEPVMFPVPIEKIVERILGLDFDWIEIEEQPGEQILAGLIPEEKRIVLNSKHLDSVSEEARVWNAARLGMKPAIGTLILIAQVCTIHAYRALNCRPVWCVVMRPIETYWWKYSIEPPMTIAI